MSSLQNDLDMQHAIDRIDDAQDEYDSDLSVLRVIRYSWITLLVSSVSAFLYGALAWSGSNALPWIIVPAIIAFLVSMTFGTALWIFVKDELRLAKAKLQIAKRSLRDLQLKQAHDK